MSTENPIRTVHVEVQPQSYPVVIGANTLDALGRRFRELFKSKRVVVITDSNVGPLHGERATTSLVEAGLDPTLIMVPAGEGTKSLDAAARLYDELAAEKIDRDTPLVALGGGVVGDLTGFVAATWLRGVPFVQCPTTIEADVDSSVGGKTGVNHSSGKNMIGAFYQPRLVLVDTETLRTLSPRDFRAGLAESIKHAVIADAEFFAWHEHHADAILDLEGDALGRLIEHNVRIKADVVAKDEREVTGHRALLNFGHTIGHAVEAAMARRGDPWRHGECVAVGMIAAAEMSVAASRLDRPAAERIAALIERIGLPTNAPLADAREELYTLFHADKKAAAGRVRFVLADAVGRANLYDDIQDAWIAAGLDRVLTRRSA